MDLVELLKISEEMGEPQLNQAQWRRHLDNEVIQWKLLGEDDVLKIIEAQEVSEHVHIAGEFDVGRVLVVNAHGAAWTMSVEDFDRVYQAR